MTPLIEEILNAMRNSPEVREAIRRELLTPELLELPERFAAFSAETVRRLENLEQGQEELREAVGELRQGQERLERKVGELGQSQERLERKVGELGQGQERLERKVGELGQSQERLERKVGELGQGQERLERKVGELGPRETGTENGDLGQGQEGLEQKHEDLTVIVMSIREDLRPLKAAHARNAMKDNALEITLTHDCLPVRELTQLDLYRMMRDNAPGDISRGDQESFRNADLVVEGQHEETGEIHYFAMEASFTGGISDIHRAVRNAGYLARFTGGPAHAVVACINTTPEAESAFGQYDCARYEIPRRLLEAE